MNRQPWRPLLLPFLADPLKVRLYFPYVKNLHPLCLLVLFTLFLEFIQHRSYSIPSPLVRIFHRAFRAPRVIFGLPLILGPLVSILLRLLLMLRRFIRRELKTVFVCFEALSLLTPAVPFSRPEHFLREKASLDLQSYLLPTSPSFFQGSIFFPPIRASFPSPVYIRGLITQS